MTDNPLKQYFRRPSIYITLPSKAQHYTVDVLDMPENENIPVYPMTSIDEITSRTPDALYNGQAVVDIIKSCIPAIKNPWKINSIDLDSILIAIRIASNGETMDIVSNCPACNKESKYGVNLVELLHRKANIDYDQPLIIRDLSIKFRPLTFKEINDNSISQFEIQKMIINVESMTDDNEKAKYSKDALAKLNKITSDIVSNTIDYIETPETRVTEKHFIKEFLDNCDRKTNALIKEYSIELKNKNENKPLKLKCVECQNEYQQQLLLNMSDFFE